MSRFFIFIQVQLVFLHPKDHFKVYNEVLIDIISRNIELSDDVIFL